MTEPRSVPALARTDVRTGEPEAQVPQRRSVAAAVGVAIAVFAAVVVLLLSLVFVVRADPALLNADIFGGWH